MGYDLNEHQLIMDILDITFPQVVVDRTTNAEGLFLKLQESGMEYDLIILDLGGDRRHDQEFITMLRESYPRYLSKVVVLFDLTEEKFDEQLLLNLAYLTKPFSLDAFGELIKKVALQ